MVRHALLLCIMQQVVQLSLCIQQYYIHSAVPCKSDGRMNWYTKIVDLQGTAHNFCIPIVA